MRVMYVDDCPDCGCPMIADEPELVRALLATHPTCGASGCACHVSQRLAARAADA